MTWIAAALLVVGFLVLLQLQRVPTRVGEIGAVSREALATLRNGDLPDEAKEAAMRAGSVRLFGLCGRILLATLVALAVPAAFVALLAWLGVVEFEAVLDRTLSWQILVGSTVLGVVVMRVLARRSR